MQPPPVGSFDKDYGLPVLYRFEVAIASVVPVFVALASLAVASALGVVPEPGPQIERYSLGVDYSVSITFPESPAHPPAQ